MVHITRRTARSIALVSYFLLLSIGSSNTYAADKSCSTHGQSRPSIGLALSGGGARGAAHVGVLKVLEKLRIPVDCISGTSMGAIIGGLYASGMTTAEIEQALVDIDWDGVFKDKPERGDRTFRRKGDDLLFLVKQKVGVTDGDVNIASALVQGQKFNLELKKLTLPVSGIKDFDHLRIPYRAVATDITHGSQVVLGSGDLAQAMRASMAVPAAFAAVSLDNKLLVDGGISNNLPISVVRDMGADIIIAVDISTPLRSREELDSALAMVDQLSGLLTRRNTEAQIATLTEHDLLILPDLGDIGSGGFNRALEAVATGQTAAESMQAKLGRYTLAATEYDGYLAVHPFPEKAAPIIEFVHIEKNSRVSRETIAAHLGFEPGDALDLKKLEAGIGRVYGMDVFESVDYDLQEKDGKTGVVIQAQEKSWGTDSIQAGLELSADLEDDSFFNLGIAFTKMPLNSLNGEWRTIATIGEEPSIFTEIYQPLDPAERWFINAALGFEALSSRVYEGGDAVTEYDIDRYGGRLAGGYNFDTWGRLQLGWRRFKGNADVSVGDSSRGYEFNQGEMELRGIVDTLDNLHFPRKGIFGSAAWIASRDTFGADLDFDQYRFRLGGARSWSDHTLLGIARYDTTDDSDAPPQNLFRLGGFLNLSGLQQRELSGQHSALLLGGYMYRMTKKIVPTYVGGSFELGNTWQHTSEIELDNTILAGSLFIGADTPLGPVYAGLGHAEGSDNAVYIFLGQPWFRP